MGTFRFYFLFLLAHFLVSLRVQENESWKKDVCTVSSTCSRACRSSRKRRTIVDRKKKEKQKIVSDTYAILARFFSPPAARSFPLFSFDVGVASVPYARILDISFYRARWISFSSKNDVYPCGITSGDLEGRMRIPRRDEITPFRDVNRVRRDFEEGPRADAEISAVPRRDLPHNDARSPSSMNAPIFPFNKLMP